MPIEPAANKISEDALNAFLDGILAELSSPPDSSTLTKVRSIFRKRIPFHLRSYAASLLILRAAGIARPQSQKPAPQQRPAREPFPARPAKTAAPGEQAESRGRPFPRNDNVPMVPLFVSMGKRQRLRPQELRSLIGEKTGIATEELGRVHLFDNYSFIDVPEALAEKIIAASDGSTIKGKTVEIKPAKKRAEQSNPKEQDE